jgi:hypothetical protein
MRKNSASAHEKKSCARQKMERGENFFRKQKLVKMSDHSPDWNSMSAHDLVASSYT